VIAKQQPNKEGDAMKEVPKKELPDVSGGQVTTVSPLPSTTSPEVSYPQYPTIPGPTDQIDPWTEKY
jgi:hypothetical protein